MFRFLRTQRSHDLRISRSSSISSSSSSNSSSSSSSSSSSVVGNGGQSFFRFSFCVCVGCHSSHAADLWVRWSGNSHSGACVGKHIRLSRPRIFHFGNHIVKQQQQQQYVGPYGPIWAHVGPCGLMWAHQCSYGVTFHTWLQHGVLGSLFGPSVSIWTQGARKQEC
jgi:hypothetical protein